MELKKKYTPLIIEKHKKVTKNFSITGRHEKSKDTKKRHLLQNLDLTQIISHFNGSLSSTNHSKHLRGIGYHVSKLFKQEQTKPVLRSQVWLYEQVLYKEK